MTNNQLFIAFAGLYLSGLGFLKYYIDAKIDPISKDVAMLVQYLISHEGRISRVEEKARNL
jgi:hypothetical protein